MKTLQLLSLFIFLSTILSAQTIYFPPNNTGSNWESVSPESLGWNTKGLDTLFGFLDYKNTKAFLVLHNGKIVIEKYYGTFTKDSIWYWASAGKTVTAFLVGMAQEKKLLSINDVSSKYLGKGWTSLTTEKESLITIRHQLSMSSGLNDVVADPFCTLPSCLVYKEDASKRWAYHNAPYTLLDKVIENASGQTFNQFYFDNLRNKIGMDGLFLKQGYNNVNFSTPRSMARYGILIQAGGNWNGTQIMTDTTYFREMTTQSQLLNKSYGYLWWLNGYESFMLPQSQFVFNGLLQPKAPLDAINALGKNGQILSVSRSTGIVYVRMGDAPDAGEVPTTLSAQIWELLAPVVFPTVEVDEAQSTNNHAFSIYPNPAVSEIRISGNVTESKMRIFNIIGETVFSGDNVSTVNISSLPRGFYVLQLEKAGEVRHSKFLAK